MSPGSLVSPASTATATPVLSVNDLCIAIQSDQHDMQVVKGLGFVLERGRTFALVGESGCGKSITVLALLRLLPHAGRVTAGEVLLQGADLLRLPESGIRSVRGGRIGIVFQEPATSLNPVLTIGLQIIETLRAHTSYRGAAARKKAVQWLERVGIPDAHSRFNDYPFQFSGGQKQRIMIAIALAAQPQILIADEPTTALDVTVQAQILALLADIQKEMGLAILLITHDLSVVKQVADYVALMRHGEIVEFGLTEQFFNAPRHPYARELLAAIPTFEKRGQPLTSVPNTALKEAARAVVPDSDSIVPSERTPILSVKDLSVSYRAQGSLFRPWAGATSVVRELSLDLYAGQTLALLGESGCGKTTVAKALLRLLDKQARVTGHVTLDGQSILDADRTRLLQARSAMQIVFQDPYASLNPRMRVGDVLEEGVAALAPHLSRQQRRHRVTTLLDRVGLPKRTVERYPHEFSGGQRQRIAIARALAVEPKVLVCDEPTSALDVSVQAQLLELLQQLQRESGMAYLFITHNFGVVEYLSDYIAVMHQGQIVEMGDTASVLLHPVHEQTRRLLESVPRL